MDYSDYYRTEIGNTTVLSQSHQLQLIDEAKKGNKKSEQKLIDSNLKFVLSICLKYKCKHLDTSDLVDECVFGMIKAIHSFEKNKNVDFLSYAVWWIRLAIQRAIAEKDNFIRIPANIIEDIRKENKKHNKDNDISVDIYKFKKMKDLGISFDSLISNSNLTLSEILADENTPSPDHILKDKELKKKLIKQFLGMLTEMEQYVIEHLFGINGKKEITITKLSRISKINPNALKTLYSQALERFRSIDDFFLNKELYEDVNENCELD